MKRCALGLFECAFLHKLQYIFLQLVISVGGSDAEYVYIDSFLIEIVLIFNGCYYII